MWADTYPCYARHSAHGRVAPPSAQSGAIWVAVQAPNGMVTMRRNDSQSATGHMSALLLSRAWLSGEREGGAAGSW